jgi:DNA mismatch repair protein MutS
VPKSADAQPELALQGSLFGEPEPAQTAPAPPETPEGLSDAALGADAAARPRQRLNPAKRAATGEGINQEAASVEASEDDAPPWAHHSQLEPEQLTPVLRHYVELKRAHPERVLLYRLGDFFECFFEDAITLSRELELTLTGKDAGKTIGRVPMAGIPHHAAERYCSDLIRLGYSVALCDQLETTPAKGALLKRDITRVLTPGTVLEEGMLSARRNNWLAAVWWWNQPTNNNPSAGGWPRPM